MAATKPESRPARPAAIDVVVLAAGWRRALPGAALLCRRAARAALAAAPAKTPRGTIAIALGDDKLLRELNHRFRGQDKPTNVLSFAAQSPDQLGDIALALQTVKREAAEQGKPLRRHLIHLVVHGTLHLLGHDHERPAQARRMENLERRVLARMGLPDPYELPPPPIRTVKYPKHLAKTNS